MRREQTTSGACAALPAWPAGFATAPQSERRLPEQDPPPSLQTPCGGPVLDRQASEGPCAANELCRLVLDHLSGEAIFALDRDGRVTLWSAGATQLYGYPAAEALGRHYSFLYPPEAVRRGKPEHDLKLAAINGRFAGESRHARRDGSLFDAAVSLTLIRGPGNETTGLAAITRDVTARRQLEAALRSSEERLSRILETGAEGALVVNAARRITFANRAAETLLGIPRSVLLQRTCEQCEREVPGIGAIFLRVMRTGETVHGLESVSEQADGSDIALRVNAGPLRSAGGALDGVVISLSDATERRRAEEARVARERLRESSRRLLEVEEAERRRIARELHDEVGQVLTGLKMILDAAVEKPASAASVRLLEARALAEELIGKVRDLSLDLRPAMLDDLGLLPALLWLIDRYSAQTGVAVRFTHTGITRRFPAEVETTIYRVAQEALTNIARHARTPEATAYAWADSETLGLRIEDEGCGFDADAALSSRASSGLSGMRDRTLLLGGQFSLDSAPGAGARITVELPLHGME